MRMLPALALAGCLAPYPVTSCESAADCRSAFGLGAVCGGDGFCSIEEANPRCLQTYPDDLWQRPEDFGDHLVLGAMFDLGPDLPNLKSALLAVGEASQAGLPGGIEVAIVGCSYSEDDAADGLTVDEAVVATSEWLRDTMEVPAIIGPGTSGASVLTYETLAADDILLIAPSATSPELITIDGEVSTDDAPGLFWRPAPPDDVQAAAIAADLAFRGVVEISVVFQDNAYGRALAELVQGEHGGVTKMIPYVDDNGRNLAVPDAVASPTAEEVVFITSDVQDVVAFLNSAALLDSYDGISLFLTDAATDPYLFAETTPETQAAMFPVIRGSRPALPSGAVYDTYVVSYAAAYDGEDPTLDGYNPYAYDAGWMAMYGLAWATQQESGITGTNMARGLRQIASGSPTPVGPGGWTAGLVAFSNGDSVDLEGASGQLDFDPVTGETVNPIEIWVPRDETFRVVALCEPNGPCISTDD